MYQPKITITEKDGCWTYEITNNGKFVARATVNNPSCCLLQATKAARRLIPKPNPTPGERLAEAVRTYLANRTLTDLHLEQALQEYDDVTPVSYTHLTLPTN